MSVAKLARLMLCSSAVRIIEGFFIIRRIASPGIATGSISIALLAERGESYSSEFSKIVSLYGDLDEPTLFAILILGLESNIWLNIVGFVWPPVMWWVTDYEKFVNMDMSSSVVSILLSIIEHRCISYSWFMAMLFSVNWILSLSNSSDSFKWLSPSCSCGSIIIFIASSSPSPSPSRSMSYPSSIWPGDWFSTFYT